MKKMKPCSHGCGEKFDVTDPEFFKKVMRHKAEEHEELSPNNVPMPDYGE